MSHTAEGWPAPRSASHDYLVERLAKLDGQPVRDVADCPKPSASKPILPSDSAIRKQMPMARGLLDYFPAALAAVSQVSYVGNEKHNAGQPMHWSRDKSADHADCIIRHLAERGQIDPETGLRHSAALAWRALALLQLELEEAGEVGVAVTPIDARKTSA